MWFKQKQAELFENAGWLDFHGFSRCVFAVCSQLDLPQVWPFTAGPGGCCWVSTPLCAVIPSSNQPEDLGLNTPGFEFQLHETMQSAVKDTQEIKAHEVRGKWTYWPQCVVSGAQKALSPVMARQPPLRSLPDGLSDCWTLLDLMLWCFTQVFPSCYFPLTAEAWLAFML